MNGGNAPKAQRMPLFCLISLGVDFEYSAGLVEEFFAAGHEFIVHFAVFLFVFFEIFCAVFLGDASVSLLLDDKQFESVVFHELQVFVILTC